MDRAMVRESHCEKENRAPSSEEEDLLLRSVKKAKGHCAEDSPMDEVMNEKGEPEKEEIPEVNSQTMVTPEENPQKTGKTQDPRSLVSYKDTLLGFNGHWGAEDSEEEDWMARQRREEAKEDDWEDEAEDEGDDPFCPTYRYPMAPHKETCRLWKKALIVKLMGKRIGAPYLKARLQNMWGLTGTFEFIDAENDYYIVKVYDDKEYDHILQDGPWIVADHYVVVQRWRPFFDPYDNPIKKQAIWLRIPGLPIEFYTTYHLTRIGNMFGKTLKVDKNSIRKRDVGGGEVTERAKLARICVEVDLRKSFLSKFKIAKKVYHVGYEGLHFICFACGKYGHRKDQCPLMVKEKEVPTKEQEEEIPTDQPTGAEVGDGNTGDEAFGAWMIVQRTNRRRTTNGSMNRKDEKRPAESPKIREESPKQNMAAKGGLRFMVIETEGEEVNPEVTVQEDIREEPGRKEGVAPPKDRSRTPERKNTYPKGAWS